MTLINALACYLAFVMLFVVWMLWESKCPVCDGGFALHHRGHRGYELEVCWGCARWIDRIGRTEHETKIVPINRRRTKAAQRRGKRA